HQQPQRQQPVGVSFESDSKDQHVPQHVNRKHWKSDKKSAQQGSHRARSSEGGDDTAIVEQAIENGCRDTGKHIENRIDYAAPPILKDETGEPEKPHVADEMNPTRVEK